MTPEGETWDTIGDFRFSQTYWDGRGQEQYLYGTQVYEVPYGDELIRGDPQTYEYQILDRTGIPRLIVRKTSEPRAVSQQDVEAVVTFYIEAAARRRSTTPQEMNQLRRTVEGYPRATNKPAYSNILIDPERNVWVERFRWFVPWSLPQDPTPTIWDVFAPSGEWIGEVEVPTGVLLLAVSRNRALGVRIDEVDVRHVLVFELQPSPTKR